MHFVIGSMHSVCCMSYGQPISFFSYYWGKQHWLHFVFLIFSLVHALIMRMAIFLFFPRYFAVSASHVWKTIATRSSPGSARPSCQFLCSFFFERISSYVLNMWKIAHLYFWQLAQSALMPQPKLLSVILNFQIVLLLHHVILFQI